MVFVALNFLSLLLHLFRLFLNTKNHNNKSVRDDCSRLNDACSGSISRGQCFMLVIRLKNRFLLLLCDWDSITTFMWRKRIFSVKFFSVVWWRCCVPDFIQISCTHIINILMIQISPFALALPRIAEIRCLRILFGSMIKNVWTSINFMMMVGMIRSIAGRKRQGAKR